MLIRTPLADKDYDDSKKGSTAPCMSLLQAAVWGNNTYRDAHEL